MDDNKEDKDKETSVDNLFGDDVMGLDWEDDDGGDLGNVFDDDNDDDGEQQKKKPASSGAAAAATIDIDDFDADAMMNKRKLLEGGDRSSMPPPTWHSDTADKPHRDSMTREIALLLKARKKTAPTAEWLQQLPHKARVLEERLYRTAPSLEAYLSRSTLKNRLKKLAVTITHQYQGASSKSRSSSFASRQSQRMSATSQSTLMTGNLSSMNAATMAGANFLNRSVSDSAAIRNNNSNGFVPPELAMSELERQKLVNEQLQKQILENIRQQQQLVQSISQKGSGGGNNVNGSTNVSNLPGNSQRQQERRDSNQFANLQGMGNIQQQQQRNQFAAMNANQFTGLTGMSGASGSSSGLPDMSSMVGSQQNGGSGGNGFATMQAALLRQQSMPMPNAVNSNMLNSSMQGNMQVAMLRRNSNSSSTTNNNNNTHVNPLLTNQSSNPAAALQAQAAFMQQAAGSGGNAAAQAQLALMRQAAASGAPINPQAMAALLRQASGGGNNGGSNSAGFPSNNAAALMNQQFGGNNMALMPSGLSDMSSMFANNPQLQSNPALLQQVSGGGSIAQNGMSQMSNVTNNAGNANGGDEKFQSKNSGEDLSMANSFEW